VIISTITLQDCVNIVAGNMRTAGSVRISTTHALRAVLGWTLAAAVSLGLADTASGNDDIRDLPFVLDTVNDVLETSKTNVQVPWQNPATGNSGVIVVERTFYTSPDMPCRQYRRTYNRPGTGEVMVRGTGCRIGPSRWKIEEDPTASPLPKAAKSGPSSGSTAGAVTAPPSPVGTTAGRQAPPPQKATPRKVEKKAVKAAPKSAKAKPKPPPEAPELPKFTMPSKAEI